MCMCILSYILSWCPPLVALFLVCSYDVWWWTIESVHYKSSVSYIVVLIVNKKALTLFFCFGVTFTAPTLQYTHFVNSQVSIIISKYVRKGIMPRHEVLGNHIGLLNLLSAAGPTRAGTCKTFLTEEGKSSFTCCNTTFTSFSTLTLEHFISLCGFAKSKVTHGFTT